MTQRTAPPPVTPPDAGRVWVTSAVLSVAAGIAAAAMELGAPETVYLAVVLCVIGCVLAFTLGSVESRLGTVLARGLQLGLAASASIGLLAAFGVAGALWVAGIVVGNRRVWQQLRRCVAPLGKDPAAAPPAPDELVAVEPPGGWPPWQVTEERLSHLSLESLCLAWRRSYVVLGRARSTARILQLAEQRGLILDEIDRRDPRGMTRWLASNPRAAGNPLPFLGSPGSPGTADPKRTEEDRP